jgi:hypothetical protein
MTAGSSDKERPFFGEVFMAKGKKIRECVIRWSIPLAINFLVRRSI